MKNVIAAAVGVAVLAGGAILLNMGELSSADLRPIRLPCDKVTDELCPAGVNKLGDYCLCYTLEKPGDVAEEVTADKIPANERVRVVLCCDQVDPETKQKSHVVTRVKGLAPVPAGCQVLKPKEDREHIVIDASSNNVWLEIDDVAKFNCCLACPDDCWIRPGSHGQCPTCLCDGTCGDYCPEE
jgi:hypothetical protein